MYNAYALDQLNIDPQIKQYLAEMLAQQVYGSPLGMAQGPDISQTGPMQLPRQPTPDQEQETQGMPDITALLGGVIPQYSDPSPEDKKEIFMQALNAAGAAMLSAPIGQWSKGFGDATAAFTATRNALTEQWKERMDKRAEAEARGRYNQGVLEYQQGLLKKDKDSDPEERQRLRDIEYASSMAEMYPEAGIKYTDQKAIVDRKVGEWKEGQARIEANSGKERHLGMMKERFESKGSEGGADITPEEQLMIDYAHGLDNPASFVKGVLFPEEEDLIISEEDAKLFWTAFAQDPYIMEILKADTENPDLKAVWVNVLATVERSPKLAATLAAQMIKGQILGLDEAKRLDLIRKLLEEVLRKRGEGGPTGLEEDGGPQ